MTRDQLIFNAKNLGIREDDIFYYLHEITQLIDMAVKEGREACAKVAEAYEPRCDTCPSGVANAIRAMGTA